MNTTLAVWAVLILALVAANLPFVNQRLFLVGPSRAPSKSIAWQLLELVIYGVLVIVAGRLMEGAIGQNAPQGWEFYAVLLCLFLTLAFPGFVWRHLRRHRG